MKFSTGDKMLIRKTGEEGYIVSLIGNDMAEVSVDGTVFPIYLDEIDHPYLKWFTEKNQSTRKKKVLREQIPVEKPLPLQQKAASGIHLIFMPVFRTVDMEEQVEQLRIYIANHTHHTVAVLYEVRVQNELLFRHQGVLQPFSDLYLHYLDWEIMQEIPRFEWNLKETISTRYAEQEGTLKIRSAKLFEQVSLLQQENKPSFQYTLLQEFNDRPEQKEMLKPDTVVPVIKTSVRSVQQIPKYELDLHIEQLVENTKGMSHADMLHLQLTELDKYLDIAIRNRQDRMVVIHGNGKGTLRLEVQRKLKENSFTDRIESGWQAGYGFGATIVYFKY